MSWDNVFLAVAGFAATVGAAYLGARIGGNFTLTAVEEAHQRTLSLQKKNQESLVKALLQAIYDEIDTVWELYKDKIGPQIEALNPGDPFPYYVPVNQDYFTMYNANAILIGNITDADLRKAIVTTYTKARGLIDSFRLNNEFVQKMEYWNNIFIQSQNTIHQQQLIDSVRILADYANKIKKSHDSLKSCVTDLLRRLNKEGVIHEIRNQ